MNPEASLQNLRDIVVPDPPSPWPPAPGVWILLVVCLAVAAALALWWWRRRASTAYRRAGLALLDDAHTAREVHIILKRVALAVWPRPEIAPLYGDDWTAFLDGSCSQVRFASLGRLEDGVEASSDLRRLARTWIRHHRAPSAAHREGS